MKYRVLALWNNYRTKVVNPKAPDYQVKELRRAFYAGAECVLNRLGGEMSAGDSLDDKGDEQVVHEVNVELLEFAADVKAGRA